MYRIDDRLQLGLEFNPGARELGPLVNYMVNFETENTPMINFGTSSDRIGTPAGEQSYYFTFAKTVQSRVLPYVSLNYSEYNGGFNFPFGASFFIDQNWVLMPMYDGQRSHLMLTYRAAEGYSASLMWVWFKHPGVSLSWQF